MKEIPITQGSLLAPFFTDAYDSCAEAFIQGIMGRGFCDSQTNPTYGVVQVGDFCILGGNGDGPLKKNVIHILKTLVNHKSIVMVPLSGSWNQTLTDSSDFHRVIRYAMDRPSIQYFNKEKLQNYITRVAYDPQYVNESSSRKYILRPIDDIFYTELKKQEWSSDFVSNYDDYPSFEKYGLGYILIEGSTKQILAGASSYSTSQDSIEISIATNPAYEGKGFATAAAARFILECIRLGKRPSWDAANLTSVHIAEKLGYHLEEEYVAYELN